MSEELRPCPFCKSNNTTLDYYEISCPQELGTIVVCNDCGASAKSIVDWNTRPIEDVLQSRIAELEAAQRWIPVSERLPVDGQDVLMACTSAFEPYYLIYKGWHSSDSGSPQWSTDNGMYFHTHCYDRVTHWLPLPEPPEVQE